MAVRGIITGDKHLDKLLAGMPLKMQKKLSRKATRKAAKEIVLPDAQARAPFDTGDLEESLTVKAVTRKKNRVGHMVTTKEGFYRGDQFYGAFMEFGTKERQHKSGRPVGRIDPSIHQAFMRPAVYDNEGKIKTLYVTALDELIREESK